MGQTKREHTQVKRMRKQAEIHDQKVYLSKKNKTEMRQEVEEKKTKMKHYQEKHQEETDD